MAPTITISRSCWACKHFSLDFGTTGYGPLTPAEGAEVGCEEGHFNSEVERWDPEGMTMRTQPVNLRGIAISCPDFDINPKVL